MAVIYAIPRRPCVFMCADMRKSLSIKNSLVNNKFLS